MPSAYSSRPGTRRRQEREKSCRALYADREKWLRNSVEVLSPGEWGRIHFTAVFVTNVTQGTPTRGGTSREKNKVPLPAASFFSLMLTRSCRKRRRRWVAPLPPLSSQIRHGVCAAISTICRHTIETQFSQLRSDVVRLFLHDLLRFILILRSIVCITRLHKSFVCKKKLNA